MALALGHTYRYAQRSTADTHGLALVTALDHSARRFFEGRLLHAERVSQLLLGISDVVRSRFFVPPAMLGRILLEADPVITCEDRGLRFEGFSSCCSCYARLDLDRAALDGQLHNRGTTNVEFSSCMRAALAGMRPSDAVRFSIGMEGFELTSSSGQTVERKVELPLRWIKGFCEAGVYLSGMELWTETTGPDFRRFLGDLPSQAKGQYQLDRRGLRLSQQTAPDRLEIGGITRLRLLKPVARHARHVRIYKGSAGVTAWELDIGDARFLVLLSADAWLGLSGEGQALSALARSASATEVAELRAALRWNGRVEDVTPEALMRYAASGVVGYDLRARSWFYRELPFDLKKIDKLNPRLAAARKLTDSITIEFRDETIARAFVTSNGVDHRVTIGGRTTCTCPWFMKHGLSRGPCKHLLAFELVLDET